MLNLLRKLPIRIKARYMAAEHDIARPSRRHEPHIYISAFNKPPPFYSQAVNSEVPLQDGFLDRDEALFWQERGCGVACIRMVLHAFLNSPLQRYADLAKEGFSRGYLNNKGWHHRGLATLLKSHGVPAEPRRLAAIDELGSYINQQKVVILSVTPGLRGGEEDVEMGKLPKGGHLVLAYGYRTDANGLITAILLHDPDYWPSYQRINAEIEVEQIIRSWNGNAIICG